MRLMQAEKAAVIAQVEGLGVGGGETAVKQRVDLFTTIGRDIVQARLILTLVVNAGEIEIAGDLVAVGTYHWGASSARRVAGPSTRSKGVGDCPVVVRMGERVWNVRRSR
jgi:hypothetical protein